MMKNLSKTLASRIAILNLQGFSQSEILDKMVAYLMGQTSAEILSNGPMSGAIIENYAISEIFKSYW